MAYGPNVINSVLQNPFSIVCNRNMIHQSAEQHSRVYSLGFFAILVIAAILRVYGISAESPWTDEIASIRILRNPSVGDVLREATARGHLMPGYFILAYFWSSTINSSVVSLRLFSVLAGLVSIGLLYHLVRKAFSPIAGLAAAALMAVSKAHIFYSQEIRSYSWTVLLSLVSFVCLYHALHSHRRGWWIAHAVANAMIPWFHIFALPVIIAQAIWLLLRRENSKLLVRLMFCNAAFLLFAAPWYLDLNLEKANATSSWIPTPSLKSFFRILFLSSHASSEYDMGTLPSWLASIPVGTIAGISIWLLTAFGLIHFLFPKHSPFSTANRHMYASLLIWLISGPLLLFVISYAMRPVIAGRYIMFTIPPLCACAGVGFAVQSAAVSRVTAALFMLILFSVMHAGIERPLRPDWYSLTTELDRQFSTKDLVFVPSTAEFRKTIEFYLPSIRSRVRVSDAGDKLVKDAIQAAHNGLVTWIILEHDKETLNMLPGGLRAHVDVGEIGADEYHFGGHLQPALYRLERRGASRLN
jgi:uncharacterized membrane protein